MKNSRKKKIVSLTLVTAMALTTVFVTNVSNVGAMSNADQAKELVSKMSLKEKIGQKLMLSFRSGWTMKDGTNIAKVQNINDEIYELIGTYDIGNVILFAANFDADAKVNVELTEGLQRASMDQSLGENSIPLLIGTDQEGGIVYRLTGGTALPGNMALGATNNTENALNAGKIIGSELNAVGVNVNFGPDTDVNNNPNNPVIGLRSFSSHPDLAADFSKAYIQGVQSENVATTAKHFPGHGNVATDSHTGLPSLSSTKEELYETELVPFLAAIEQGTDMIMTAHIQFPNIVTQQLYSDKKGEMMSPPATLSRELLTDLLRDEMNFDGVIVTDSMTMDGVAKYFDVNERNLLSVQAGVDILDIPFNDISSWADMQTKLVPLIDAFVDAYTKEDGYKGIKLSLEELDASVERILTCKFNRGVMDLVNDTTTLEEKKENASAVVGSVQNRETERLISANAVTVVKNDNDVLPLKLTENSKIVFASTYSRNNNRFILAWERAKSAGIIPEGADYKILQHYNWTGLNDKVNSALNSDGTQFAGTNKDVLDWGDTLVHASEISSASGIDGYLVGCPQLFSNYCKNNGKTSIIISLNHPYDVQAFPDADGILAVFGTTSLGLDITESFGGGTVGATAAFSPNLTGGTEVVLGTFGASGKLPVDIPKYVPGSKVYSTDENVYEFGYGLTYDALVQEPNKDALKETITLAQAFNEDDYTTASLAAAENEVTALKDTLKTAMNYDATYKLTQSIIDEMNTTLQDAMDQTFSLLVSKSSVASLTALIVEVNDLERTMYTDQTWAALEEAITNANTAIDDGTDQQAIDDAFVNLQNAKDNLMSKISVNAFETLTKAYEELEAMRDSYSEVEFVQAATALSEVKALLEKGKDNISVAEASDAVVLLAKAKGSLQHNVMLESLRVLVTQANLILTSDELMDVRPGKVEALTAAIDVAQALLEDNSTDNEQILAAENNLYKAIQELYKIVNKQSLQSLVDNASLLTEDQYSEDSWKVVEDAIEYANMVISNDDASVAEVQDAYDALMKGISELTITVNKSALEQQLNIANKMLENTSSYIKSTIMNLETVVKDATAVFENPNATQEEIKTATINLIHEIAKARLLPDKKVLESAINVAQGINLTNFSSTKVADFKTALAKAQEIMNDENATQEEVDAITKTLEEETQKLVNTNSGDKKTNEAVKSNGSNKSNGAVKSGDSSQTTLNFMIVLLSGAVLVLLRKHKKA